MCSFSCVPIIYEGKSVGREINRPLFPLSSVPCRRKFTLPLSPLCTTITIGRFECTMNCRELGIRETSLSFTHMFYTLISDTTWLSELVSWTAPSQCTVPLLSLAFTTTLFPSNQSVSLLSFFTPFLHSVHPVQCCAHSLPFIAL